MSTIWYVGVLSAGKPVLSGYDFLCSGCMPANEVNVSNFLLMTLGAISLNRRRGRLSLCPSPSPSGPKQGILIWVEIMVKVVPVMVTRQRLSQSSEAAQTLVEQAERPALQ